MGNSVETFMYFAHINLAQLEFSKKAEATKLFQYLGSNHSKTVKQHLDWKGNSNFSDHEACSILIKNLVRKLVFY